MAPPLFNIVLVHPEIPSNTGNIGRSCVAWKCKLHLIGPLGFAINDKYLKRAGLDYWPHLEWIVYSGLEEFQEKTSKTGRNFYFSKTGDISFSTVGFQKQDWFWFGSETKGLPPHLLKKARVDDRLLKIPFPGPVRSLNLANAASIVMFEAYKQLREPFST